MRDIIRYNNSRGMMVHSPTNRGRWVLWKDVAHYIKEARPTDNQQTKGKNYPRVVFKVLPGQCPKCGQLQSVCKQFGCG